jgi:hypothetical protein
MGARAEHLERAARACVRRAHSGHSPLPWPLCQHYLPPRPCRSFEMRFSLWALEDLNLRPLPCQGSHSGVRSNAVDFGRLLDQMLTDSRRFNTPRFERGSLFNSTRHRDTSP